MPPIPVADEIDRRLHDDVLNSAPAELESQGISGKDVTPFLLGYFHEQTHGRSLDANVALVRSNASLAGRIAAAVSG